MAEVKTNQLALSGFPLCEIALILLAAVNFLSHKRNKHPGYALIYQILPDSKNGGFHPVVEV